MATNNFITNTASLKTTIADVRRLNAKKIYLEGENILDIINSSTPTIEHSQDTRETVTENDLWGQYIETTSDGTIIVHDDWVTNPNASNYNAWNTSITTVEDNKAYVGDTFFANVQTEKIKDGTYMFYDCNQLNSFTSDLSSLTNADSMFYGCTNLASFSSDLSSLTKGDYMFYCCNALTIFSFDSPNLTNADSMFRGCSNIKSIDHYLNLANLSSARNMFERCNNLESFDSILPSLRDGTNMFYECDKLTLFTPDLSTLLTGANMFNACNKLTSFNTDLPSLSNGSSMFNGCIALKTFNFDLHSLIKGDYMFFYCYNLTTFSSDLSSLTNGNNMFEGCSKLTSISSDLSSLVTGYNMFSNCKLDAQSVMYIINSINDIAAEKQLYTNGTIPYVTEDRTSYPYKYSAPRGFMSDGKYVSTFNTPLPYATTIFASDVGKLTLGINVSNNADTIQQQLEDFAKEATYDSWEELKQEFVDKGWTVTFQYGGKNTTIPYDLRNGEQIIPCQIFAKLVQVEDKDSAQYCSEDASSFYNIEWGHDVTDTSSYTQFDSLEDAMTSWNVFPKENIITTEE